MFEDDDDGYTTSGSVPCGCMGALEAASQAPTVADRGARRWVRHGRSSKLKSLFGSEAEATERSRTKSFAYQAPKQPKAEAKKGARGASHGTPAW